ncbi:MAG TPA: hypothetical protein VGV64_07210, partial [Thermoplasmata archaeon]|nr:hypothetical protein [Thermoplasmata archaeon]
MNAPADSAPGPEPAADGLAASRLALRFGLSEAAAKRLSEAGFSSIERVRAMSPEELREAGLNEEEAERVRSSGPEPAAARPSAAAAGADDDRMTERLLSSLKPRERGRVRRSRVSAKASAEILRKWVDGDDQAMEAWIRSPASLPPPAGPAPPEGSEPGRPDAALEGSAILGIEPTLPGPSAGPASPAAPAAPRPVSAERPTGPLSGGAAPAPEVRHLAEREATLVHWLSELLERVKSEQFDPGALLTELQDLHRDLFDERTRRAELEEEIEQVKRGSIAVIKYVRSREARAREQTIHDKDAEIADLKLKLLSTTDRSEGP